MPDSRMESMMGAGITNLGVLFEGFCVTFLRNRDVISVGNRESSEFCKQ